MPLRLALGVRGTVAGHRLGALGGVNPPPPMHPCPRGGGLHHTVGALKLQQFQENPKKFSLRRPCHSDGPGGGGGGNCKRGAG